MLYNRIYGGIFLNTWKYQAYKNVTQIQHFGPLKLNRYLQVLFVLLHGESVFGIKTDNTTGIIKWEIKKRKIIEREGKTLNKMNYYNYEYSSSKAVILKKKRKTRFHWMFSFCKNKISEANVIYLMYFNKVRNFNKLQY